MQGLDFCWACNKYQVLQKTATHVHQKTVAIQAREHAPEFKVDYQDLSQQPLNFWIHKLHRNIEKGAQGAENHTTVPRDGSFF